MTPGCTLIVFTLDESTYARELAPLAPPPGQARLQAVAGPAPAAVPAAPQKWSGHLTSPSPAAYGWRMGPYTATRLILSLALTSTLLAACGYGSSGTPTGNGTGNSHRNAAATLGSTGGTNGTGTGGTNTGTGGDPGTGTGGGAGGAVVTGTGGVSTTGTGGGQAGTGGSVRHGDRRFGRHQRECRHHRHHRQRRQHGPFGLGDAGCGRSNGDRSHGHGYRQHRHHGRGSRPQVHGIQLRKDPHHERTR